MTNYDSNDEAAIELRRLAQKAALDQKRAERAPVVAQMALEYEQGASLREIADTYGYSAAGVRGFLIESGVEMRGVGSARFKPLTADQLPSTLLAAMERLEPDSIQLVARAVLQSQEVRVEIAVPRQAEGELLAYQNLAFLCFDLDLTQRTVLRWLAGVTTPADYDKWLQILGQCGCNVEVFDRGSGHVLTLGDRERDREARDDFMAVAEPLGINDETPDDEAEAEWAKVGGRTAWLLRKVRQRLGVSLSQLATDTTISEDELRRYERGTSEPSYRRLYALVGAADMTIRLRPATRAARRKFKALKSGASPASTTRW